MSFFDDVLKKYAPTYVAAQEMVKPKDVYGNRTSLFNDRAATPPGDYVQPGGSPIDGGMAQPVDDHSASVSDATNPHPQFGAAPVSSAQTPAAPIPAPAAVDDSGPNPYAQWAKPEAAPTPAAAPVSSTPAPADHAPVAYDPATMAANNRTQDMSPDLAQAAEANRQKLATLINNGASKAEIGAYLKTQGIDINQVDGLDAALAQRAKYPGTIIPVGTKDTTAPAPVEYHGADNGKLNSALHGALDGITLGAGDELDAALSAGRGAIENTLGYGDGKTMSQTYDETLNRDRQLLSDSEHYHPWATFGGQVAGNLALAPLAPEAGLAEGALAVGGRAALEGAAMGGAYGFNSATGGIGDRLTEGAKGAAAGGLLGGGLGAIGGRIAANRAAPSEARGILDAADQLNAGVARADQIRPILGHTSNGGLGSTVTALAQPLIVPGKFGGVDRAVTRFADNAGAARNRIADAAAGGAANDLNTVAARQANPAIPNTLAAYEEASRQASNALYDRAATLAGDVHLQTPDTVAAIDRKLAEWRGVPGGVAGSQALQDLRDQLATSQWTVDGLRRLRTSFGDSIDSGNRTVREAANSLWPTLSRDITMGLRNQGMGDAARAYRAADQNYVQRAANLDSIGMILGDGQHSADTVADNITRMSRTDYDQLSRAIGVLPVDQQNSIRGAIVEGLGRANPSKQNAAGDQFSLETFLTQWQHDKFSDQAKAAILPAATVRDLDALATLAGSSRALSSRGNPSRSGVTVGNIGEIVTAFNPIFWTPHGLGSALALFGGGRLLASPGFARALVRGSESRSIEVLSRRLGEVARRNPAMAQNILGFRDAIVSGKVPGNAVTVNQTAPADPTAAPVVAPADLPPVDDSGPNPYAQYARR